jgi:hypothetical protein
MELHVPVTLQPGERAPGIHWIVGWGGAQSRSGRDGEKQPPPETQNPYRPARSLVAMPTELSRLFKNLVL